MKYRPRFGGKMSTDAGSKTPMKFMKGRKQNLDAYGPTEGYSQRIIAGSTTPLAACQSFRGGHSKGALRTYAFGGANWTLCDAHYKAWSAQFPVEWERDNVKRQAQQAAK